MAKKTSRRAFKRAVAERNLQAQRATPPLPESLAEMLDGYEPGGVDTSTWSIVRPVMVTTMRCAQIRGEASFRKHLGVVAKYLVWRVSEAMPLAFPDCFNQVDIDRYYLHGLDGSDRTRNDYRSRLTNIARRVNPSPDATLMVTPLGHRSVRPGYSAGEMIDIRRVVQRQSSLVLRRQLCAAVGLCAGAGLSSTDLRWLRRCHITDHGSDGIEITITGAHPRVVWVRIDFEDLVRIGIDGLSPDDLVIGTSVSRRNVVGNLVARAELGSVDHLDASRLRSTWLTWLLTQPVPLATIMAASGLQSARTLTELLDHLDSNDTDLTIVRTGSGS